MEQNKKDAIITAVFHELREAGLPSLSYELVSKRSGISRQLIHYYFPDKDDLMIAVCDRLGQAYREALVEMAAKPEITDRLGMIIDFIFDFLDEKKKPRDDQVYDAVMCLAAKSIPLRERLRGQYSLLGNVVSHEITITHPHINTHDADTISYLIICLMYGHWKMVASLGMSEGHRLITRRAVNRIIRSYEEEPNASDEKFVIWSVD